MIAECIILACYVPCYVIVAACALSIWEARRDFSSQAQLLIIIGGLSLTSLLLALLALDTAAKIWELI
jgi:hypothetical protein